MDPRTQLLAALGVAVPAVLAGAVLLVRKRWAGGLALALAVAAGVLIVFGGELASAPPPPLALVAIAAALVGAVPAAKFRLPLLAVVATAAPWIVLRRVSPELMTTHAKLGWGALHAAIIFLGSVSLDRWSARNDESVATPLTAWVLAAGGAGVVLIGGHYITGAQVAGMVAAGLGALAVLTWWRPAPGRVQSAMPVVANVLPGAWLLGYYLSNLPAWIGLALGLAPLLVWIGELPKKLVAPLLMAILTGALVTGSLSDEDWATIKAKVTGEKPPAASTDGY